MNKEELIAFADKLGIEHYNECDEHICLKGVNGYATLLYTDIGIDHMIDVSTRYNRNKVDNEIARIKGYLATELDFANHLKQMGRDSLKMDLDKLLNVMHHG